jgi:S-adenosyl methyltransferase
VRQFVDVGSGLPTSPCRGRGAAPLWLATHEAARAVAPDAMVAYVDSDPVAVAHSQALLASGTKEVVAAAGDLHDPATILGGPPRLTRPPRPRRSLVRDWSRPGPALAWHRLRGLRRCCQIVPLVTGHAGF